MPEVGSEVKKGEQFGVIESVKVGDFCAPARLWFSRVAVQGQLFSVLANPLQAASDVNSPVSGEVSSVNDSLTDESSMVCPRPKSVAGFSICSLGKGTYSTCVFSVSLLASGLLLKAAKCLAELCLCTYMILRFASQNLDCYIWQPLLHGG